MHTSIQVYMYCICGLHPPPTASGWADNLNDSIFLHIMCSHELRTSPPFIEAYIHL